jgi:hypothetical protein
MCMQKVHKDSLSGRLFSFTASPCGPWASNRRRMFTCIKIKHTTTGGHQKLAHADIIKKRAKMRYKFLVRRWDFYELLCAFRSHLSLPFLSSPGCWIITAGIFNARPQSRFLSFGARQHQFWASNHTLGAQSAPERCGCKKTELHMLGKVSFSHIFSLSTLDGFLNLTFEWVFHNIEYVSENV